MSRHPIFSIAFFLLLLSVSPGSAEPGSADLSKEIESQQKKIKRVREEIEDHHDRVLKARAKESNLFGQLEVIEQALRNARQKLAGLNEKTARHEKLIEEKVTEVARRSAEKEMVKEHVEERLAAYYRMGDLGLMNATFSAGTLPDLLNFNEYFKALIKYDQQVIDDYRLKIEMLTETRKSLEEERAELLRAIATAENQAGEMESVRKERIALLARVNTEKKLYRRAIEEMEQASTELTETLAELRGKFMASRESQQRYYSSPKKRRPGSERSFSMNKGRLPPPVRGSVTTFFGKSKQGKFGITTHADGIDIKTVAGTEIKAIHSGKVVYAGQLKGYGNLIIIDHGHQYYSLISRAAELYKKEGEVVSTGEAIGIMNDGGGLLGEGLHFEIRHGTEPLDPLDWLNREMLNIGSAQAAIGAEKEMTRNN
ncbi:MAG: murein hydrolase activator EnvC [Desulfurivibrionaceae bacterium]